MSDLKKKNQKVILLIHQGWMNNKIKLSHLTQKEKEERKAAVNLLFKAHCLYR